MLPSARRRPVALPDLLPPDSVLQVLPARHIVVLAGAPWPTAAIPMDDDDDEDEDEDVDDEDEDEDVDDDDGDDDDEDDDDDGDEDDDNDDDDMSKTRVRFPHHILTASHPMDWPPMASYGLDSYGLLWLCLFRWGVWPPVLM